jgi:MFS family permease
MVVLGVVGGLLILGLFGLIPLIVVLTHSWPWLSPEPSFILAEPSGHPPVFWASLGLLVVSFIIRLARRLGQKLSVLGPILTVFFGTIGWYIHAHTVLGTATYFIFTWFLGLGAAVPIIYAISAFLGGLAPGFLGAQGVLLYLVYHDPRLLTISFLPAVIGEVIDSLVGDIREKGEEPKPEVP